MNANSRMYDAAKTWNPFKGCLWDCSYCIPSFQQQAKRQLHNCSECYHYRPHEHSERLAKIPSAEIIFVAGNGDICFAEPVFTRQIIAAIKAHNSRCPKKTYYFQSKQPAYFEQFLGDFSDNVILVTTLETNRDSGYGEVSKAPPPSVRYAQFKALGYPRKVVTIEPVMDFDECQFVSWIVDVQPEYVWLGYNSRPRARLCEPSEEKLRSFVAGLRAAGVALHLKDVRGLTL